jgi:PAS domain-containing protein
MPVLDREEYIEQAYFFHAFRDRLMDGQPSQDVLARVGEEILSTTRLPMAIAFMYGEMKAVGLLGPAMARIAHYFTPFQAFVVSRAEEDVGRFSLDQALLILERESRYRAEKPTPAGLFVYQFETIARNRLGYGAGLDSMGADPFFDENWSDYIVRLRSRLGDVDFADLIYVRSAFLVSERRRRDPQFEPKLPILFGEKEGKIARANRGRDPLYLFSALQRQLGYPEVPRPHRPDEAEARLALLELRVRELENRLKIAEGEIHNELDLGEFVVKPEDTAGVPSGWGVHEDDLR